MSNIILFEEKPSAQVSIIYEAIDKGVMCTGLNDHNLYEVLKIAATAAYRDLGYDLPPDDDLKYILLGVIRKIRHKKLTLRDREIMIAFQNGVQGDYGKFFGLNVVSFVFFLTSHATHPDRLTALSQRNNPEEPKKEPPSLEEQFNTSKINALAGYKLFLKDTQVLADGKTLFGSTGLIGSVIYDFFFKIQLFLITQEEIDDVLKRGHELHFHELKVKRSQETSDIKRKETEKQIAKLIDSLAVVTEEKPQPGQLNPLVIACAKRIYVDELYQGYYADEVTIEGLEELINAKKPKV